MKVITQLHSGQ